MRQPRRWLWWAWARQLFQPVANVLWPASPRRPHKREVHFNPLELRTCEERNPPGSMLALLGGADAPEDLPAIVPLSASPAFLTRFDHDIGSASAEAPFSVAGKDRALAAAGLPADACAPDSSTPAVDAVFTSLTRGVSDTLDDPGPFGTAPHGLPLPPPLAASLAGGTGPAGPAISAPATAPTAGAANPAPALQSAALSSFLEANALPPAMSRAPAPAPQAPAARPQAATTAPPAAAAPSAIAAAAPAAAAPPSAVQAQPAAHGGHKGSDPLYVLDVNNGLNLPANTTLNSFSAWPVSLWAQVSNATVSSYSWSLSQAPDASNVSGSGGENLQFTWASFSGAARSDTITLTTTNSDSTHQTFTLTYQVAATSSPLYSSQPPTSSSTWPGVQTPDQVQADQATKPAGPYAALGLQNGDVQTAFALPAYNPGVAPLSLRYSSATAYLDPIFLTHYQLSPSQGVPATITATLTLNGSTAQTSTYYPDDVADGLQLNQGDYAQIALSGGNASGLTTGRYPWQVQVTPAGGSTTTSSGSVDLVSQSASPFGAGWSLSNVSQIVSVSGGVILVQPGGTSLWFANGQPSGTYVTPAGDFSTLVQNTGGTWTRTLPDGTQINFNSSGLQTSIVDRVGNTTTFAYNGQSQLTALTDMNGQVTSFAYNGSGKVTGITDPANRTATLAYSSGQTTAITGPDNKTWNYTYVSNNLLKTLKDPDNHTTTFGYNPAGLVTQVTQPDGVVVKAQPEQAQGLLTSGLGFGPQDKFPPALLAGAAGTYTDGLGDTWSLGMDWQGLGQVVTNADPLGEAPLLQRDGNDLPWLTADALGRATREFFDSKGNVTLAAYADGSTDSYQYNSLSEVTQHTDATGGLWTYNYDSLGNLTQALDPLGHGTTYGYTSKGSVSSITDALNHTWTLAYDSTNRDTSITDPLGHTATLAYDSASDVTSATDVRGFTSTYAYDALDRLTQATLPDSQSVSSTLTLAYDAVGNLTSLTDPLGHATTYGYDAMNRLSKETDPLSHSLTFAHDSNGNLTAATNALGKTTSYSYDKANHLTQFKDATSALTTLAYDAASEVTKITDPLSRQWQYTYTPVGLLSSITDPLGDVVSYGYDAARYQTSQTESATGHTAYTATVGYDAAHRLTSSTDALGNQTTYGYDNANNQTSATDPLGHAMTYGYDALNRLTSSTDALSKQTTIAYDNAGNLTSMTDPLARMTTYSYDAQDRELTQTDPNGGTTSYAYDLAGRLTSLTDPVNNQTTYGYDNADNETSMTDPLGHAATYAYDAANELTATTDRNGRQRTFAYDAVGRETTETWVSGSYTATLSYDAVGQLTKATDPSSTYTYTYDNAARLKAGDNAGTTGVPHVQLTYGYDVYNNETSLSDTLGGSISYTFDGGHRLTGMSTPVTGGNANVTFGYDAASRMTAVTRTSPSGDTITSAYSYDTVNRLTNITHSDTTSSTTLASYSYGYDAASQLTSYTGPAGSLSYSYDPAGQLTGVSGARNETYSYDKNGNRTMSGYRTGTGNELLNDGTYTYAYDKEGNLTSQTQTSNGQTTTYTYDYRDRLTEAVVTSSTGLVLNDEKFTYDVNNNRIGVKLNGTQQVWTVYDGANPYIDFNGSGTVTERYLTDPTGLDEFYARVSPSGAINWYLTDNLGSVRQVMVYWFSENRKFAFEWLASVVGSVGSLVRL
jgi:YD repeat-containing protein